MKKLLLLLLILTSCGARKVEKTKTEEKSKTEITDSTKTTTETNEKVIVVDSTNTDETEIVPIDNTKPIIINGKSYFNAVLKHKKVKNNKITVADKKAVKIEQKAIKIKNESSRETFAKNTERKDSYWYLWIILLLIVAYIVNRKFKII